jgi:hypothetical protein
MKNLHVELDTAQVSLYAGRTDNFYLQGVDVFQEFIDNGDLKVMVYGEYDPKQPLSFTLHFSDKLRNAHPVNGFTLNNCHVTVDENGQLISGNFIFMQGVTNLGEEKEVYLSYAESIRPGTKAQMEVWFLGLLNTVWTEEQQESVRTKRTEGHLVWLKEQRDIASRNLSDAKGAEALAKSKRENAEGVVWGFDLQIGAYEGKYDLAL